MFIFYFLIFILISSFVLCIYIEIKFLSPTIIFWIALSGIFLLPHLIHCLFLHTTNLDTLIKTTIFVSLFNFLYFFAKVLIIKSIRKKRYNWIFRNIYNFKNERVNHLLVLLYSIGLALWILGLLVAGFNPLSAGWADTLNVNTVFSQIGNILIFTSSGIILYNYLTGNTKTLIITIVLSLSCIILLRARILLIALLIPFLLLILYRNNKINIKLKFVLLILTFTFLLFFLQAFRWSGGINKFTLQKIPSIITTSLYNITGTHGEFHLVTEFYTIVEKKNITKNFGEGRTYWRLALFWLPSPLIPEHLKFVKPRDFAIDMYNLVHKTPENNRGTTHPTFYGDLFANFGWSGFFMAIFWAFVTEFFDQLFRNNQSKFVFMLGNISTFYIIIARGAIYNGSFTMIITLFIISILYYKYKIGSTVLF